MTFDIQSRISTFRGCGDEQARPLALAKAGFSFDVSTRDLVCQSCGLRLKTASLLHHQLGVHERLAPHCEFLRSIQSGGDMDRRHVANGEDITPEHTRIATVTSPTTHREATRAVNQGKPRLSRSQISHKRGSPDEDFLMEMRDENRRLETYFDFPGPDSERVEDLAEAGFFYISFTDHVQCAFCNLILKQWTRDDVPATEHRKHAPHCPFVTGQAVGNAPALLCENTPTFERQVTKSMNLAATRQVSLDISTEPGSSPKIHKFAHESIRLESFHGWPAQSSQKPVEMARAGFYYLGDGDNVQCFHCGGVLNGWEKTDVPLTEHTRWFPMCGWAATQPAAPTASAASAAPRPTSQSFSTTSSTAKTTTAATAAASSTTTTTTTTSPPPGGYAQLLRDYDTLVESMQCAICMDAENNVVFMPCGHTACSACAARLRQCHICRKSITSTVQCFIPQ